MRATLTREGGLMFTGPLEAWAPQQKEDPKELQVYTGSLDNGEMYCALWSVEEWTEHDRSGRTHVLYASGTLRQSDGVWQGEVVHIGRGNKIRGWRATAQKGARVVEFADIT